MSNNHNTHYATIELTQLIPHYEMLVSWLKDLRKNYPPSSAGYDDYLRDLTVRGLMAELDAYDRVFRLAGVAWNGEEFESL